MSDNLSYNQAASNVLARELARRHPWYLRWRTARWWRRNFGFYWNIKPVALGGSVHTFITSPPQEAKARFTFGWRVFSMHGVFKIAL